MGLLVSFRRRPAIRLHLSAIIQHSFSVCVCVCGKRKTKLMDGRMDLDAGKRKK